MSPKGTWPLVVRYGCGITLCLLGGQVAAGEPSWAPVVMVAGGAALLLLGDRRLFRAAVHRVGDEVVCRYVPWYESNGYLPLVIPMIGVAALARSFGPGAPEWMRYLGVILLALTPAFASAGCTAWRRSLLRISLSALTIRTAGSELIEIPRDHIDAIAVKIDMFAAVPVQVDITYRTDDPTGQAPARLLLGKQLSVDPVNLFNALTEWKDSADVDRRELLDRIETGLRGRRPKRGPIAEQTSACLSHRRFTLGIRAFGTFFLILAGLAVSKGPPWLPALTVSSVGAMAILGYGQKFRPAVSRSPGQIVCRYLPWREGNAITMLILLPCLGIGGYYLAAEPGQPRSMRVFTIVLAAIWAAAAFSALRLWRRARLTITPSALLVSVSHNGPAVIDIGRDDIEAITLAAIKVGAANDGQLRIDYRAADDGTTRTVVIGPTPRSREPSLQLSVETINLDRALQEWRGGGEETPTVLLDRIEQILRSSVYAVQLSNTA